MYAKFTDESQSRGWSKRHRHKYMHDAMMTAENQKVFGYYLANPNTTRCQEFSRVSGQMYSGKIPIDIAKLKELLAAVDEERKARGM